MLDIQSLTEQVQPTAAKYGWWTKWSQLFIGATAIVAMLYFVFSGIALKRSSELKAAQDELSKAKDDQLATDLRTKDQQIADTYKEAKRIETDADQKIADTNKETKRIETEAQKEIARLTAEAETARADIAKANERAKRLEKDNLTLRKDLETATAESRAKEAKLEEVTKRQEWRQLPTEKFLRVLRESLEAQGQSQTVFLNQPITVLYDGKDSEAENFANQIEAALTGAGWKRVSQPQPIKSRVSTPLPTVMTLAGNAGIGVTVTPRTRITGSPAKEDKPVFFALLAAFAACGFEPKAGEPVNLSGPVRIIVGSRH